MFRHCDSMIVRSMVDRVLFSVLLGTLLSIAASAQSADDGELFRPNDRVAWLGGRTWELMQEYGELEARLAIRLADFQLVFRNCAWSGDDLSGHARAVFGNPEDGYQRRIQDLKRASPSVVFVAYGQAEAVDGWPQARFRTGLERLVHDLHQLGYRVVLFRPAPIPAGTQFPEPRRNTVNQRIIGFGKIIDEIAKQENCRTLEFPQLLTSWTQDGLQPHPMGFIHLSIELAKRLAPDSASRSDQGEDRWDRIQVDVQNAEPVQIDDWRLGNLGADARSWRWSEQFNRVPESTLEGYDPQGRVLARKRALTIRNLPEGTYQLTISGVVVGEGTAEQWNQGVAIRGLGTDLQRSELQQAVIDKNLQFMHAYRPQNETYLFLFRKHEQGNNAIEADQFADLTAESDLRIQTLAHPKTHIWELSRIDPR